jgi:hypothetical protein
MRHRQVEATRLPSGTEQTSVFCSDSLFTKVFPCDEFHWHHVLCLAAIYYVPITLEPFLSLRIRNPHVDKIEMRCVVTSVRGFLRFQRMLFDILFFIIVPLVSETASEVKL